MLSIRRLIVWLTITLRYVTSADGILRFSLMLFMPFSAIFASPLFTLTIRFAAAVLMLFHFAAAIF